MASAATVKLTPLRATLLRLVAYSEITRHYHVDGWPYFTQEGQGQMTDQDIIGLTWLAENGFVRCVGELVAGRREGLLRPTGLGEEWLDAHRSDR
jgi:hypothetical protein